MSCSDVSWFGFPIADLGLDELTLAWAGATERERTLMWSRRADLWRVLRGASARALLQAAEVTVLPVGGAARRHVRAATGCRPAELNEFQATIRLLATAEEQRGTIYIVDTDQDRLQRTEQNLRATFPGLRVVGRAWLRRGSESDIDTAIRKASPRVVLAGVCDRTVLQWIADGYGERGATTVVVAPRAVARVAALGSPGRAIGEVVTAPLRLALWPVLWAHRLRLRRAQRTGAA